MTSSATRTSIPGHEGPAGRGQAGRKGPRVAEEERDERPLSEIVRDLETRVARLEALVQRDRSEERAEDRARTFRDFALQLYRHVDQVALHQRANFDRELAALRRALGQPEASPPAARRPGRVVLSFGDEIIGYGIHAVQRTSTGKLFRHVHPRCGILVPAVVPGPARLVVQGIRRSHDGALEGARLAMNGQAIPVEPYVNPRAESWNITATVPAEALRPDGNLLELRLPNGPAPGATGAAAEAAVGILEISLTAEAALPDPDG